MQRFDAGLCPAEPDYGELACWAARPGAEGFSALRPGGERPEGANGPAKIDLFYIHPTTFRGPGWNQDVADRDTNNWTDRSVLARQATIFNGLCRIYAPRYRQASSQAFAFRETGGDLAYDLAYQDVERAFWQYLRHDNDGRPFILFGHSQGALHLSRLLETVVEGLGLQARMVAAYVIGIGLSTGMFGRVYQSLKPALAPAQTGGVLSWNTFLEGSDTASFVARAQTRYRSRCGDAAGEVLFCVNPLTFDADQPDATAKENLGALVGLPGDLTLEPLIPALVGARCRDGLVFIDRAPEAKLGLQPLPGGNMHMHDTALFYDNIRRNAALRISSFLTGR